MSIKRSLILLLAAAPAWAVNLPGTNLKAPEGSGDKYEWLERGSDPKVVAWTAEQDKRARAALDARPGRAKLRKRLEELMAAGIISDVKHAGSKIFYRKREGAQNQPVLYYREIADEKPTVLLDPNALSADGTTALDWWYPSQDGVLLAYGVSEKGSEESTLRVREVDSLLDLPDSISRTRHASVAWLPGRSGFYYTRYPAPGEVPPGEEKYHRHVFFHTMGGDPLNDEPVWGRGRPMEDWPDVQVSPDGRYLLVSASKGWSRTDLYLRDLTSDATGFVPVVEGREAVYEGRFSGDNLYLLTNDGAPRFKIQVAEIMSPYKFLGRKRPREFWDRSQWKTVVPERKFTITGFDIAGSVLAVQALERAVSRVQLITLDGRPVTEVPVPPLGSVSSISGQHGSSHLFFVWQSFFSPPALYDYPIRGALKKLDEIRAPAALSDFESEQVSYKSKDGTPISMFLVKPKRLRRAKNAPTLLTGYGGFSVNMTPTFSPHLIAWLERGGLYALPNLRGGGEYGEEWHQAGMLSRKQNTFDDFLAAADWLIEGEYTRPERLAISGGSNGGLLVGAALTQAPSKFRAAVAMVPLMDMLKYHRFLLARLWIPEYGSPDEMLARQWLADYSPYHRVREGTPYPAVLLMSGESDTRVDPMHARKMAAKLQAATSSGRPVLLRMESKAGHGAGKPLSKTVDELVDRYGFLFWQLGMEEADRP